MRNWEVGVLVPVFEGCGGDLVVPFKVPVRRYARGDVPWVSVCVCVFFSFRLGEQWSEEMECF